MKKNPNNQGRFYQMFCDHLRNIYSAECQIIDHMPKVINAATTKELKEAFQQHLKETKNQKTRLEKVFSAIGESSESEVECESIKGLLKDMALVIKRKDPSFVEDAELIAEAQKIEHFEIATYGTLVAFAQHLKLDEVSKLLQEILNEEGKTNKALTKLAEGTWISSGINAKAVG